MIDRCVPRLTRGLLVLVSPRIRNQQEGEPGLAPLRGPLRYSLPAGATQLGLRPQTVLAHFPPEAPLLGAAQGGIGACRIQLSSPNGNCLWKVSENPSSSVREAFSSSQPLSEMLRKAEPINFKGRKP